MCSSDLNKDAIDFPRASIAGAPYDFSFSGLKSSVLNYLNSAEMKGEEVNTADIAASFQEAVVDVLVSNTIQAAKDFNIDKVAMAGGVASNSHLRETMKNACKENNLILYYPKPIYCTDNAAMIASAAYYDYLNGNHSGLDLNAVPNLKLGQR